MPEPYKHHVIPQVHLRAFSQDGHVRVHDVNNPRATRVRHVSETAYVEHAYTIQTRSGPSATVEKKLFARIENLIGPVIQTLQASRTLTSDEWGTIGGMVATQAARDGHGRTFLSRLVRELMTAEESKIRATDPAISEEELQRKLDRFGRSTIVQSHIIPEPDNVSVAGLSALVSFLHRGISGLQGTLLQSTGRDFIMSDSPVYAFEPALPFSDSANDENGEPTVTTEITMPLTRRHAVLLTLEPIADDVSATNEVVAIVNSRTLQSRWCTAAYAYPDPETVDDVARNFNNGLWRLPMIPILRSQIKP